MRVLRHSFWLLLLMTMKFMFSDQLILRMERSYINANQYLSFSPISLNHRAPMIGRALEALEMWF